KRAYCLKTQPATGETYPKSDLFNKAYFLFHHCGVRAATSGYAGSVFFSCALFVPVSASG
ncbi:hypothetical protein LVS63_22725, partial [Klebsiella pneumoniae]|nr:hypothetical protein [Klebsiella pneumoniae]